MKLLKNLDRSYLTLVLISVCGILLSSLALYFSFKTEDQTQARKDAIAKLSYSKSDTRIKRSGNLHWYPVEGALECFQNDLVFTGEEASATITFPKGDRVHLLPNTLISISDQRITLENGVIEVDLNGQRPLTIESLGKVATSGLKTKFRIIQTSEDNKIIPISGVAPTLSVPQSPNLKEEKFEIISPRPAETIARFPDSNISFTWIDEGGDQDFKINIGNKFFVTRDSSLTLPAQDLKPGNLRWSVTNGAGKRVEAEFDLTDDYQVNQMIPETGRIIHIGDKKKFPVEFSWTSPLPLQEKLQISKHANFSTTLWNEEVYQSPMEVTLGAGIYFWRVGYVENGKELYWSTPNRFEVTADAMAPGLGLKPSPELLDFSTTAVYKFAVIQSHPTKNIFYHIKGAKTEAKVPIERDAVELSALPNGSYTLSLSGELEDGSKVRSPVYEFSVENTEPIEAPKIRGEKVKIFVQILRKISDLIFPAAHAQEIAQHRLEWEGQEGDEFEIEITEGDETHTILTKRITDNLFEFKIPKLGLYFWRVRQKKNGRWGRFSKFTEIVVEDKINLLEKPLMKAVSIAGDEFTFSWDEPFPDFKYTLHIYSEKNKAPILSLPVSGKTKTLKLDLDQNEIFWNVTATSIHGNTSKDAELFVVPNSALMEKATDPMTFPKDTLYLFRAAYQNISSSYKQGSLGRSGLSNALTGSGLSVRGERWKESYGFIGSLRQLALAENDTTYSETEFMGELGWNWKRSKISSQLFAAGLVFSGVSVKTSSAEINYSKGFLSIRHQYDRVLSQKFSWAVETTLLQQVEQNFVTPSLRISSLLNFYFTTNWWLSLLAGYEMNKANLNVKGDNNSKTIEVSSNNLVYGLGLNWKSF